LSPDEENPGEIKHVEEELIEEDIAISKETLCIICCDKVVSPLFYPCGHRVCCQECAEKVKQITKICPICRKPVKEIVKVYSTV